MKPHDRSLTTSPEARATARLLYTGAVGFMVSAQATHERSLAHPTEPEHWPAICVNLCFALELSLKAFVASRGTDRNALKALGHNLARTLHAAEAAGYQPQHPAIAELVGIFSPLHVNHGLRYLEDKSVEVPDTRNAVAIVRRHIRDVGAQIPITTL